MKKLLKLALGIILFVALMVPGIGFAGDSECLQRLDCIGNICVLRLAWTSSDTGTFTGFTTVEVNGWIDGIETVPSATASPTDNYDINIKNLIVSAVPGGVGTTTYSTSRNIDGDSGTWSSNECTTGEDGVVANRDATTGEFTRFLDNGNYGGILNKGPLVIDISNAGNSKSGVINIPFFRCGK